MIAERVEYRLPEMQPWFFVVLVPVLLESLVLWVRPQWLAPLAFLALPEHRFTLRSRRRELDVRAGYRDRAQSEATLPELPARTELSDSVLFATGSRLALRRAYGLGRRQIWLVGITMVQAGDEIVLRAKQALVPVTLPLVLLALFAVGPARDGSSGLIMVAVFLGVFGLQHLFTRGSRDEQLDEAYSFVEGELRRHLEEPPARRAR